MTHATVEAGFWAELARVHWPGSFGGGLPAQRHSGAGGGRGGGCGAAGGLMRRMGLPVSGQIPHVDP